MSAQFGKEEIVINEFLNSIGKWKDILIIGGGYALFIYAMYFNKRLNGSIPLVTKDLDSLLPRRATKIDQKDIANHLKESGFSLVYKDFENPPTEVYIKEIHGVDLHLEFITDNDTRGDKTQNVMISGVSAIPLSYQTLSLKNTLKFKTSRGAEGLVVSPGAWIFNKGLIFSRRRNPDKLHRDLYGLWWVASQLGEFSNKAIGEFHHLSANNRSWFREFRKNIHNWVANASQDNWSDFIEQDKAGNLDQRNFLNCIESLIQEKVM